jgi:hypothetical protein
MLQVLNVKRSTVHAVKRIDLNTTNKVVTVAVYSTAPLVCLLKLWMVHQVLSQLQEAGHTGSGWETLSFDFSAPKMAHLLQEWRICKNTFLSFGSLVVVLKMQQ